MTSQEKAADKQVKRESQPYRIRLPGFVSDTEIGFGDVVGKAAAFVGVKACGGCQHRAATLNGLFSFSGRRPS
jgi:hypothetical protein